MNCPARRGSGERRPESVSMRVVGTQTRGLTKTMVASMKDLQAIGPALLNDMVPALALRRTTITLGIAFVDHSIPVEKFGSQ